MEKNNLILKDKIGFHFLCAIIILWFLFNFFFGERVFSGNGLGWDGQYYAKMVEILDHYKPGQFSYYYTQRIFPSLLVFGLSKIFRFSVTDPNVIIHAFFLYNLVLVLIILYTIIKISKLQKWNYPIFLIGFSGLFLNYSVLKMLPYYPVLTDFTAYTLGLLMLYFFLINNTLKLFIVIFISAFTFPTMIYIGLLFIIFPKQFSPPTKYTLSPKQFKFSERYSFVPVIIVILLLAVTIYLSPEHRFLVLEKRPQGAFYPSLGAFFAYGLILIVPFFKQKYYLQINYLKILSGCVLILGIKLLLMYLADPIIDDLTMITAIKNIFEQLAELPFISLVSHFVYFGPVFLLLIIFWNEIVKIASENIALALFLMIYGFLLLGIESRCYCNAIPVLVFLLCEALMVIKEKISLNFAYTIIILSLVVSKFWLPINNLNQMLPHFTYTNLEPSNLYFMSIGPWMENKMYYLQGFIMVIILIPIWVYKVCKLNNRIH